MSKSFEYSTLEEVAILSSGDSAPFSTSNQAIEVARELAVKFMASASDRDRNRTLPRSEYAKLAASGLLGIRIPRTFGGIELAFGAVAEVVATISSADASIGQLFVSSLFATDYILAVGTEEQKADFFQRILNGVTFGNATSEIGGKVASAVTTTAISDGEDFVISGRKFYSTGALLSDLISTVCQDEDGNTLTVVVPNPHPGLTIQDDWDGFGQRTTASGTLILENVRVPKSHGFYLSRAAQTLPLGAVPQLVHCAIDLGIGRQALKEAISYLRSKARPWGGTGIERASEDPYILAGIGDLSVQLHAAEALLQRGAAALDFAFRERTQDAIDQARVAVAEAKVLTTNFALEASSKLFQFCGARSTSRAFALDRYWRDARTHTVHDPVHWKFHAIGNYVLNGIPPLGPQAI